jgi:GT2 family glycosyltransferase
VAPAPAGPAPPAAPVAPAPPVAPPVVAVVVARDPGPFFEEGLASLVEQDYANLSILVIDAASSEPVRRRVAAVAPGAFVRRIDDNPGFGTAANEVLDVVEGAAFHLFCHDDVALAPDAVRLLVEEAFRSNAGIVGPKLLDWHEPRHLLQVGEGIDKAGFPAALAERYELDQEQRDAVADVFTVPGAATLVRADLFAALGGFDEGIDFLLDDLSLCWRAHLAGARVMVAPQARARHVEALGERRPVDDRRRLQARHRLRILLTCYSRLSLLRILPQLVILQVAEVVYSVLVGRSAQARDVVGAWSWNLRRWQELRAARKAVRSIRRVPDREVRRLMVRGSARFNQFLRGQIGRGEDRLSGLSEGGRELAAAVRSGTLRTVLVTWAVVLVVLAAGSRHLITRGVPGIAEMAPFHTGPVDMLREWASGWRANGLGSESPAPTAYGLLGLLGALVGGAMGVLRMVLTLGMLPLGALFAYRLPAPTGSRYAQVVALLVYVSIPLPYNALASGQWGALVAYAALPLVLGQLARAGGLAPYGPAGSGPRPRLRHQALGVGVVLALVATLAPAVIAIVVVLALALALGSLLALTARGDLRMLGAALGGALVAAVLHLPWSLDFVLPGSTLAGFLGPERGEGLLDLGELLRFQTGPLGSGPLGWAVLVAAALPLLIGRGWRHAWAVRGWTVALVFWGLAWAAERGALPFGIPAPELLLAPAAAALALSASLGVSAFEVDLPGYRFGWRQLASGIAGAAVVVATVPVLGASFDGRWSMPAGDHARALGFLDAAIDEQPFRVLWIGDPSVLPMGAWELGDGVAYGTTDHGTPRVQDLWAGSDDGPTRLIADAVGLAQDRQTSRLGRLLAPMAIRYVVVAERLAPAPFATEVVPIREDLRATLAEQLDLRRLDVPAGLTLYENEAHLPLVAAVPPGLDAGVTGLTATARLDLAGAEAVVTEPDGHARWTGTVPDEARVLAALGSSERWRLEVDGQSVRRDKAFGWANGFDVVDGGRATLAYQTPATRYGMLAVQVLLWVLVLRSLVRSRLGPGDQGPVHRSEPMHRSEEAR